MRSFATIMRRRLARVRVSANTERHRIAVLAWLALIIAVGASVVFLGAASAAPLTFVDDGGADDEPGQKDLNSLTVDYGAPGGPSINVKWGWDDTATTGNNTLDGCALFDTDADGFANYSFCVIVAANERPQGAVFVRRRRKRQMHEPAGTDRESSFDRDSDDRAQLGSVRGPGSPHFTATHLATTRATQTRDANRVQQTTWSPTRRSC